jgi:hypothetical protein
MDKHKNNGNYFQLHPHRHTGSCRTDETETSGDLILNLTTWLETPDYSPLPNAAPSRIRIVFFQLFWIYGTKFCWQLIKFKQSYLLQYSSKQEILTICTSPCNDLTLHKATKWFFCNTHTIVNWKKSVKCYWQLWNITNMTSLNEAFLLNLFIII